jgi:hypothetical protein
MTRPDVTDWYDPIGDQLPSFGTFIDTDVPTIVVRDTQLQARGMQARAQLRSLPLFQSFGVGTVLHTDVWDNEFHLVEYEYVDTGSVDDPSDVSFPVVHVVTQQGIDEYGEERLVRRLVERSIDEGGRYVLVTDTAAPRTPGFTKKPGKSIVDEFGSIAVRDYEHLSETFVEAYLESELPIADTRNVFFHATSAIHARQGAPAASIADLFDYTAAPSNSPVWASARYFLQHDLENVLTDYSERLREALRSWTERGDTGRVATHLLDVLQTCEFDLEQFDDYRRRHPSRR